MLEIAGSRTVLGCGKVDGFRLSYEPEKFRVGHRLKKNFNAHSEKGGEQTSLDLGILWLGEECFGYLITVGSYPDLITSRRYV